MDDSRFRIIVRYVKNIAIASCLDSKLNDELSIQSWGNELYSLVDSQNCSKLVINFSNVNLMSSSALRVLISLNKKTEAKGMNLELCGINKNIMEAFRITRLDELFTIKQHENETLGKY
ncbi:MAG: STAS domain-containing protein [Planctomycetia bacterium]|nr:STAS domain-containing protein [Planctomycetia bacterium]